MRATKESAYEEKYTSKEDNMSHYTAPDYNNIVKLFNMYSEHPKTRVPSMVGFGAFMLKNKNYPAWMVRALRQQINKDPDLKYHINTIIEADLVESSLLGLYKGDLSKFILKNNHGYSDTPDAADAGGATTKQITFVKAKAPTALPVPGAEIDGD